MHDHFLVYAVDRPHLVLFAARSLEEVAAALSAQPRPDELTVLVNRGGFSRPLDVHQAQRLGSLMGGD